MAIQTTELTRAFVYNNIPLPDPGPQFNVNQVRDLWSATYPEIVNAAIEGPVEKDGKLVYTFRRAVGTKGNERGPQIGRLAMREEGEFWNAYYAHEATMQDAVQLGSIRMMVITARPERKQQFMDLMREVVGDRIEEATGVRPIWGGPQSAPEHERAGHG